MIQGIIFDMDGLLIDSEPLQCLTYINALKKFDITLTEQEFYQLWTKQGMTISNFVKQNGIKIDPNLIKQEKLTNYYKLLKEKTLFDGVIETIQCLAKVWPLALATSSDSMSAKIVLDKDHLHRYFKTTVTSNDVQQSKPNPEIFLLTSTRLGVKPDKCLVIEDAQKGIIAANQAGMKSIAIPNQYTLDNDFSSASQVLNSIKELTTDLIKTLP